MTENHPRPPLVVPSTDGVELALHDLGGTGPDLIVGHATGFHGRAYSPLVAGLLATHHVWALDFRGHGSSTAPAAGEFAWTGMAADLLACVERIGGRRIRAFGHSLGGAAILLAELERPGVIEAAYLYEPIVPPADPPPTWIETPLPEAARRRRDVFASRAEALQRYASRPPLATLRADALAAYVDHGFIDLDDGTVRLACRPEHEARTFESDGAMTLERLVGISTPVTVGAGAISSTPHPAEFAPAVAAGLENGRLIEYGHLSHFGPLQAPDLIAADVVEAMEWTGPVR